MFSLRNSDDSVSTEDAPDEVSCDTEETGGPGPDKRLPERDRGSTDQSLESVLKQWQAFRDQEPTIFQAHWLMMSLLRASGWDDEVPATGLTYKSENESYCFALSSEEPAVELVLSLHETDEEPGLDEGHFLVSVSMEQVSLQRGGHDSSETVWTLVPDENPEEAAERWSLEAGPVLSREALLDDPWDLNGFRNSWLDQAAATEESRRQLARRLAGAINQEELELILVSSMTESRIDFLEAVEAPGVRSAAKRLIQEDFSS